MLFLHTPNENIFQLGKNWIAENFNCSRKKNYKEAVWLFYTCKVARTNKGGNSEAFCSVQVRCLSLALIRKEKPTALQKALVRWCQCPSCCSLLHGVLSTRLCSQHAQKCCHGCCKASSDNTWLKQREVWEKYFLWEKLIAETELDLFTCDKSTIKTGIFVGNSVLRESVQILFRENKNRSLKKSSSEGIGVYPLVSVA